MDTTTIIIIVVVVLALALFFFMRRDGSPGMGTEEDDGVIAGPFDRRVIDVPQSDRPGGVGMIDANPEEDVVDEALDDVRSQNPNKSL